MVVLTQDFTQLLTGFPLSCLQKIPGLFQDFPGPPKRFPGRSILHVHYWTHCIWCHQRPTHL